MQRNDHLISEGFDSQDALIDSLPGPPIRTMLVRVGPPRTSDEHYKKINDMVHNIFKQLTAYDWIIGFRFGAYSLVFFSRDNSDLLSVSLPILEKNHSDLVFNEMIPRTTTGPKSIRWSQVGELEEELVKRYKWDIHLFGHFYKNGKRHELPT